MEVRAPREGGKKPACFQVPQQNKGSGFFGVSLLFKSLPSVGYHSLVYKEYGIFLYLGQGKEKQ